ncbi:(deoxy)nucleoside triphosphate pyrophosphohydrolase [Alkaliphilus serpentinus]|uniref:8-oxo-dGTP diphosphatase n=1 Tax=Alkaliphilus serpentinus TaxID=1482731 RepID=A0A833MCT1_9FIRM|nr:(deoxy)nucleoside triphosphate pyrophosphohydrolase [Alkaliphilus serpentinus]KAB3526358.1 (deoxy)nucleoside triphosphate pyrophosphohydrolase [Alkaliphilus serpentinus]
MLDVAAIILENESKEVLIARRRKGIAMEGLWEFPGGKIEEGESPQDCLVRELKEEMELDIEVQDYVGESIHSYEDFVIRLMAYRGRILRGEIKLVDHDKILWVKPLELKEIALAPADIPFAGLLLDEGEE